MTAVEILRYVSEQVYPLPEECQADLAKHCQVISKERGETLVQAGQHSTKIFFIAQGAARAYFLKDGRDVSDWFAFEGEFISSIQSYFTDVPSPHYIETLEPSLLIAIDREPLQQLADKYRAIDRLEKKVVVVTMLKLQHRIASMQYETAQQKYESLLLAIPHLDQRVPLTHIASYLGITLETLSRVRGKKGA
ncbi:MAG TPA: Crp/Fnr family transcriptional regulator [Cytophagales bacterium]|nr:Crp/Fnr family transcriptional regulator [Cytophagales bacterium]HAP65094.1 Crp/Fnr family transcriptional regulator [Cytophagales bacterium]